MAEAAQTSVKRVISMHEDFQGDEKKSKTAGEDIDQGTADPASAAATAAHQKEMAPPSPPAMVEEVEEEVEEDDDEGGEDARPIATIFHADTGSSNTTQSSLSDENCSSPALAPDGGGLNLNKITGIPRNISHGSGTVNSSVGNRQGSVGNWGWFEEVNGEGSLRGGFLPGGPGIKDGGKRRGLLDFGTELMSSIIPGLGADRRGEFPTKRQTFQGGGSISGARAKGLNAGRSLEANRLLSNKRQRVDQQVPRKCDRTDGRRNSLAFLRRTTDSYVDFVRVNAHPSVLSDDGSLFTIFLSMGTCRRKRRADQPAARQERNRLQSKA